MALTHRTAERLRKMAAEIESLEARLATAGISDQDMRRGARALWKSADRLDDYLSRTTRSQNRALGL